MRNQLKTFYSALLVVATLGLTTSVHGVPTFARQTGLDCTSCHAASGFPTLNAFGAAFKAGGFSQANEDNLLGDGETLSIPKSLGMSVVLKVLAPLAIATDAAGTASTTFETVIPDEMAVLIGGRLGANSGFLIESALTRDGANQALGAKYVFAPEIGPVRLGIVPWWSDLGAGYIFETLSTGAVNNLRPAEELKGAAHKIGMNQLGELRGLGLYVWHPMAFVAFSPFFGAATDPAVWIDTATPSNVTDQMGYYTRVAVTPSFGSVNLGVGFQYWAGNNFDGATVTALNAWAVDLQAMMDVGLPLSIYATFGMNGTASALTAMVEAGIVPDVFMAGVIFALESDTADTTAGGFSVGAVAKYHVFRNLKVELDILYSSYNDSTSEFLVLPMIFGAF